MDFDAGEFVAAVEALLEVSDAMEAFELTQRYPVLLGVEFAQFVERLLQAAEEHEQASRDLLVMREVIDAVRAARMALGIEKELGHHVTDEVMDAVAELLRCSTYGDMAAVVHRKPSLVEGVAAFLMALMTETVARGDPITTGRYYLHWEFVCDCQHFGIDGALQIRVRFRDVVESELTAIMAEVAGTPGTDPDEPLSKAVEEWDRIVAQSHAASAPSPVSALVSVGIVGAIIRQGLQTGTLEPFSEALDCLTSAISELPPEQVEGLDLVLFGGFGVRPNGFQAGVTK